jgi:hypothetical protein
VVRVVLAAAHVDSLVAPLAGDSPEVFTVLDRLEVTVGLSADHHRRDLPHQQTLSVQTIRW